MTAASTLPLLAVNGLHKAYQLGHQEIPVLKGLSMSVAAGEMVVIMGPSGSGKTTLLNCLSAIDTPDLGSVLLDGEAVYFGSDRVRTELRRHKVGIVFQFFNLIPTLSVRDNVALPLMIAGQRLGDTEWQRVDELLENVGMKKRRDHLPFQLSGGEMQLVSIARALVHRPRLLLADEPTGNVNPKIGRTIMGILRETASHERAGLVMVTHSPEHAAWADRICFLQDGMIADELAQQGRRDVVAPIHAKLLAMEV